MDAALGISLRSVTHYREIVKVVFVTTHPAVKNSQCICRNTKIPHRGDNRIIVAALLEVTIPLYSTRER